jgi:hypothetical protein
MAYVVSRRMHVIARKIVRERDKQGVERKESILSLRLYF